MSFHNKIDEWIQEAEARPESALTIVNLIAKRLRELTERNEALLAENIALENGTRVDEYCKRIAHLEYQLDLLKRRFNADEDDLRVEVAARAGETSTTTSLLVYNAHGKFFRIELSDEMSEIGQIQGGLSAEMEPPRFLAAPSNGEVLLLFSSGRVSTCAMNSLPRVEAGGAWTWEQASIPDEPRAGETLSCVAPIDALPLSDFFLQVSRRGYVKKIMTSMAQSILSNHYLGKGAMQKSDQPFDLTLTRKTDRFAFVTYEGHLLGLDVDDLSYTVEGRIRLTATDYVVGSFLLRPDESLLCVTQAGKVVVREQKDIEISKSPLAKGQPLIPPSRLGQGVRFMGAVAARDADRIAVLDAEGRIRLHIAESMRGAGMVEAQGLVLSIGRIPSKGGRS
jgi:DNA gyrase/topoisomerase IV subunit A